jgi:hypothetical protein
MGCHKAINKKHLFDANLGMVDVTPDQAKTHNDLLSAAEIEGLDKNCQVGQCGTLYFDPTKKVVHTWPGTIVSTLIKLVGTRLTFFRDGKEYRGLLRKNEECFNFKRIA